MNPFLVDVPVKIGIWIRPDCQRKQFEVIKKARPSILFLTSDGGRNEKEWDLIRQSRAVFDEIDWNCTVYKLFESNNLGLYSFGAKSLKYIWEKVDRCIFLEDDDIPAVSFFQYCAELLEKYKDDERIQMITGNNPLEVWNDAIPKDYFFSENGWSIWGTATWKDRMANRVFPLPYADDKYIMDRLKENLSPFWYEKASGYASGNLVDRHVPGGEYFWGVNGALYHRLNIVPTKNLISNIGAGGTHSCEFEKMPARMKKLFFSKTYEIQFPMNEPEFVIDDKTFGKYYEEALSHNKKPWFLLPFFFVKKVIRAIKRGDFWNAVKRHLSFSHEIPKEREM